MVTDKHGKRIKRRDGAKAQVMRPEFRTRTERKRTAYHRPSAKAAIREAY